MALIKLMLILPFCLFAIFQLIGCDEHVRKRKDSRQGKSKSLSINLIIRYHNLNMIFRKNTKIITKVFFELPLLTCQNDSIRKRISKLS